MVDFRYPVRVLGPLAPHVPGFQAEMVRLGYSPRVAQDHAYVLAHLSRWVESERLTPQQLTSPVLQRFTQARCADGYRRAVSVRYLKPLLAYLRQITIIPGEEEPQSVCPVERVLSEYRG